MSTDKVISKDCTRGKSFLGLIWTLQAIFSYDKFHIFSLRLDKCFEKLKMLVKTCQEFETNEKQWSAVSRISATNFYRIFPNFWQVIADDWPKDDTLMLQFWMRTFTCRGKLEISKDWRQIRTYNREISSESGRVWKSTTIWELKNYWLFDLYKVYWLNSIPVFWNNFSSSWNSETTKILSKFH